MTMLYRKSQDDAFTAHDPKDINIYPNRNGNDIPYKLTAKSRNVKIW